MPSEGPCILQFGPFRFHAETAELSRRGVKLRLQPQPARVLRLLLAAPGQLVSRDAIQQELWGDTLVDYDLGVNRCVRQLRSALGDDTEIPRYIRTVPRRGYCFIAPVRNVQLPFASESRHAASAPASLVAQRNVVDPAQSAEPVSIAVLPFANLTGDPQDEYFGDGLAEEITNVLAQIPSLKVIARTSAFAFKGKSQDIRKIAEALGVNHVLEGSVRKMGARMRVTAQLIHATDGAHLSSKRYDCEQTDLFALQDTISVDIAQRLHARLTEGKPVSRNAEAYDAFLEGRFYWHKYTAEGFERAWACYQRAIAHDARYASAYIGLAECALAMVVDAGASPHTMYPQAADAARMALALNEADAAAHAAMGQLAAKVDYDWNRAGEHFRRALELGLDTHARLTYVAWYLLPLGRAHEAVAICDGVIQEDPLLLLGHTTKASALLWARRYDEGVTSCLRALDIDCNFGKALQLLAYLRGLQGRHAEAREHAERLMAILGRSPLSLFTLGLVYAAARDAASAQRVVADILKLPRGTQGNPTAIAGMAMLLGNTDGALRWMRAAIDQRDPRALWMGTHPWTDSVRKDERYQALMAMMNLATPAEERAPIGAQRPDA
jgi:TolB-like protein